ncbi:hypothetical protein LPJ53_001377 [Coemansia erecta]|uniref:Enoyl reductase (ER) domain-containing protein n=1 Tax=Coemansia erecta TaxID=147472 RepID=A0A9W8CU66_9FUNG|nr:hypothetical protein LPJ53_001377 [Coemansia erecta]
MTDGKINTIRGWAAKEAGIKVEPWTYTPRPLGENDVEIKIDYCGICGTDMHILKGTRGTDLFPVIVGHEIVGRVVAKGKNVAHVQEDSIVGVGAQVYACLEPTCRECSRGLDPHCPKKVFTYNSVYADGKQAQGGYAEAIRVDGHYVFPIPENLDPAHAAPLMCAGATVFAPMLHKGVKKGDRVGIIGIGGLGHLAIQYANALGAEVVAFSHSPKKREESLNLGATEFVDTSKLEEVAAIRGTLQYLIVTSNTDPRNYNDFVTWMDIEGQIILLALPQGNLELSPGVIARSKITVTGSLIAGIDDIRKTLEFSAKHGIVPLIERFPMDKVNEALEYFDNGNAHYRIVLTNVS